MATSSTLHQTLYCLYIVYYSFIGYVSNIISMFPVVIVAVPYLVFTIVQFVAMFIHRMGILFYLLARTKCRLGGLIRCGYPTKMDTAMYDGVSIGPDDSASARVVARYSSGQPHMAYSGKGIRYYH